MIQKFVRCLVKTFVQFYTFTHRILTTMLLLSIFIVPTFSHKTTRFQGVHGVTYDKGYERDVQYFDSISGCAVLCQKTDGEYFFKV